MIVRIVKMTFREDAVDDFIAIFENSKDAIRQFPGCQHLELLRENPHGHVFFTYSIWDDQESLTNYRTSPLFDNTWAKTKALFAGKPEAYSTERLYNSGEEPKQAIQGY